MSTQAQAPHSIARARDEAPRRRTPTWIALVVGVLLLVVMTIVGKLVTAQGAAATGELKFDVGLSKHRDLIGIVLSESVSTILGPVVGPLLVIGICVFFWQANARRIAVLLAGFSASGWLASGVLKAVVHRDRPPTDVVNAVLPESAPDSFPSGHTALITAVFAAAVLIAWMLGQSLARRLWLTVVGVLAVALVGASRLYLGVHYYYDVLAAPLVAIGGVLIAGYLLPRLLVLSERPQFRDLPRRALHLRSRPLPDAGRAPIAEIPPAPTPEVAPEPALGTVPALEPAPESAPAPHDEPMVRTRPTSPA